MSLQDNCAEDIQNISLEEGEILITSWIPYGVNQRMLTVLQESGINVANRHQINNAEAK
jgi:hypothetical protein